MAGCLILAVWWVVHVHRRPRPTVLPAGFALTVAGTLLSVVAAFLLAIGIFEVVSGTGGAGGVAGAGDLVGTGATMMAAALLCGAALARQAARPARGLAAPP